MKKLFILAAVAAVAMTGCSNENGNNGAVSGNEITMRAIVDKNATRASAMTTDRFTSFHVMASHLSTPNDLYLNTAVWYNAVDDEWAYAPKTYYPSDGYNLRFYAYSPISDKNIVAQIFDYAGGTLSYVVPADQRTDVTSIGTVAEDLLVADLIEQNSGDVNFEFRHALSAATFSAANTNHENQELVYVIKDITIKDLYTSSIYDYDDAAWGPAFTNGNYVAPIPEGGVALEPLPNATITYTPLLTNNDFLIVMPQNDVPNTSNAEVVVTYNLRDGIGNYIEENAQLNFSFPTGFSFEIGTRYDFQFKFNALEAITMDVKPLEGWTDGGYITPTPIP